ncbi:MAG: magnesium chelatase subunit H [Pseudomonadota bacterium]
MQKRISDADAPAVPTRSGSAPTVKVVIVTLDGHLTGAVARVRAELRAAGVSLSIHPATDWSADPDALERCRTAIAEGDVVIASMLFLEDHINAVLPDLEARRDHCDAMVGCLSAGEVVKLTKLGRLDMSAPQRGPLALLKRLRGSKKKTASASSGAGQMAMLRRLPKILKYIPGSAQDLRAYFLTMQYWLSGSDANILNLARFLANRYAAGPRAALRGAIPVVEPRDYPDLGLYHPDLPDRVSERLDALPAKPDAVGTVGLLVMRSYLLADDSAHYDGVIRALEAKGLRAIPIFSSGLDARPAIEKFLLGPEGAKIDALVSLTGFSLVGGPAYNDAASAREILARLDAPYLAAHALEFQTLEQWGGSDRGLTPVEATMMVSIPEIDGATGPMVFGGRLGAHACDGCERACASRPDEGARTAEEGARTAEEGAAGAPATAMTACPERAEQLADRVAKLVALRRAAMRERRLGIVLFNFPPNAGATGTAAFLSVFESLHNTLAALKAEGYEVDLPADVDALRDRVLNGNAETFGADANVHHRIPTEDHVAREPHLAEIEAQWGPAPGRQLADGAAIHVLGARFGNVFVGVQPGFGYEGDPMRLLFEKGFAPTHAFSAFYRWLREDFAAHAVLHFGTHGALEFMPGKQTGLSSTDWPDRLIRDLPNFYLYAANNPSEGAIAKRRAAATLISYLTPPLANAGLYKGLVELKSSLERWRGLDAAERAEAGDLAELIQGQAAALDLAAEAPVWTAADAPAIDALNAAILELEYTLIPDGLHVVGRVDGRSARIETLAAMADAARDAREECRNDAGEERVPTRDELARLVDGQAVSGLDRWGAIAEALGADSEIPALLRALDGRFVQPAPGGDLIRTPDILPTGRNVHGFDPFRIPSAFAVKDGAAQADRLLARYAEDGGGLPETVAMVLWGTDNLKTEGGPLAQVLALLGARPRHDSYGRVAGATLIPLEELGRPRVDVMCTLSGIFRDLLPLQTRLLAEAAWLAAAADEPLEMNFVRAHALRHQAKHGCDLETAALRVFSNADGAYGSNVNQLIDSGVWDDEDELAETYSRRKCFAYGRTGDATPQHDLLESVLSGVDLAYQNLESVELGVTTIDHYFDTLGGVGRAVKRAKTKSGGGGEAAVYIGDQTRGSGGKVRALSEQVALETRTRMLNPKWYESMLRHGHEGVRNIEAQVTNTLGWSATTGQVDAWVYQRITETFVLDPEMRARLAALNPKASANVANRLIEAQERNYWTPDDATAAALRQASEDLEDRLEGVRPGVAAGAPALH